MFEIGYTTARRALVDAEDRETAKRRFAAYVFYDDVTHVRSDVEVGFGDDAVLSEDDGAPPSGGTREEMRAWLARHDDGSEPFEPALYEERERRLDPYLRLLAENDPWRLEGHGSLGRRLSAVTVWAELATTDGRIRHAFEATAFVDYLRADVVTAIDPARPSESLGIANLLGVAALHDPTLRQIVSSYDAIARELALTAAYATAPTAVPPYGVTFDPEAWRGYVAHRRAEPGRFLPPKGWTSSFPTYGGES